MMYSVFRSLCGCCVTYWTSTKRASPAREASALTMRPRSPAARNAFKNQISSLVISVIIERPDLRPSNVFCFQTTAPALVGRRRTPIFQLTFSKLTLPKSKPAGIRRNHLLLPEAIPQALVPLPCPAQPPIALGCSPSPWPLRRQYRQP